MYVQFIRHQPACPCKVDPSVPHFVFMGAYLTLAGYLLELPRVGGSNMSPLSAFEWGMGKIHVYVSRQNYHSQHVKIAIAQRYSPGVGLEGSVRR